MPSHNQVETLFRQLDLVPRVGERRESELCVMSLVALLAGERHTDRPATACPVIACYAIKINDTVDCDTRQGLKLLATRIMGTNDGRCEERAWLLARVCVNEVFAYLMEDIGAPPTVIVDLPRMPLAVDSSFDFKKLSNDLRNVGRHYGMDRSRLADFRYLLRACGRGSPEFVASAAAVTLVDCARLSAVPPEDNRYWDIAVGMFDRLCDVGLGERVPGRVAEESLMTLGAQARAETVFRPILVWLYNGLRKLPKPA
ncbi:MAG: hypothetical protein O3B37_13920 [Proteobacteria bacterium]|nr:hypothetical protein [Pseudomonadota bacterium]